MSSSRVLTLAVCLLTALLAGCGSPDPEHPGGKERADAAGLQVDVSARCGTRGVATMAAVNHAPQGKTSGFVLICMSGVVRAAGRDGHGPGAQEKRDAQASSSSPKRNCVATPTSSAASSALIFSRPAVGLEVVVAELARGTSSGSQSAVRTRQRPVPQRT